MRILITKLSSLGDIIHALPTVAELHRQLPAKIDWAVQPEGVGLVELFACVERIIPIPRRAGLSERRNAIAELRRESYDMAVDLQGLLKSAVITRFARAPLRIGPSFHRECSRLLYSKIVAPRNKNRHAIEECMDVLDFLKLKRPATPSFPLNLPPLPTPLPLDAPGPRIAIAPRSRWISKNWPLEHFAALAKLLAGELNAELHIIGGGQDRADAETLLAKAGVRGFNHCGRHSLGESCALLARMDALLANDSGPIHMAVAVNTPCVAMFGPTLPDRTGPYGPGHTVLRAENCPPCKSRVCRRKSAICLSDISPETVLAAVKNTITRNQ